MWQYRTILSRRPVAGFYVLAFAISWSGWIPQALYARGMFPIDSPFFSLLGGGGPTLAAVIVLLARGEADAVRRLFGAVLRLRAPWWCYAFVVGFWVAVAVAAPGIAARFGPAAPALHRVAWGALPLTVVALALSSVWEEIGWRGFALPRLQATCSDGSITVIMGLLWSLWHVPLLLNPASPMAGLPWYGQTLFWLSMTAIYTWLYRHTAPGLFVVTLFHALSNTLAWIFLEAGIFGPTHLPVVGATTLVALVIVLVYGPRRFAR